MPQFDNDIRNRLLVARLPAMPQILVKLIALCQSDDAGMGDLAKLIANDPAMASKCLGLANSSAYHRGGQKVGLEHALSTMGTDMLKTLVISESVFQTFSNFSHSNSLDLRHFWRHSLTAAVMAREIAKAMGYPHTEEAYLAGLLHDVGRLALLSAAPQEYAYNFQARDDENLCALEHRTLEITHSEAGAWLLERWHLDSFMADSVLYHHEPAARLEAVHPLIRIVRLAHTLAIAEPDQQEFDASVRLCGLSQDTVKAIIDGTHKQVEETAQLLGIDLAYIGPSNDAVAFTPILAPLDPVQQKLTDEVRNMALLSELGRSFSQQKGDAELLDLIARSARILFNIDDAIIFLANTEDSMLRGVTAGPDRQRLADFSIPLSGIEQLSPIAHAARTRQLTFVGADNSLLGVSEEQLLRMFGSACLCCLPLAAGERCLGVMIAGIEPWQVAYLQNRERFLQSFAIQATVAMQTAFIERQMAHKQISNASDEYLQTSRRVVHEVNNPLSIIKNYLGVLGSKLSNEQGVDVEMAILNEEIDRVSSIINGLTDNTPRPQAGPIDVNRIVRDVVQLFVGSKVAGGINIIANVPETPAEIESPADPVKQILMNLIKNAVEAMPQGGQIEVINNGRVHRDGVVYLELCIKDNGPGIADHVLSHLFTPVRSTKGGENRGIGLSIVHALVGQMKGLISCRSGHGGTSFDLLLPLPDNSRANAAIAQVANAEVRATPPSASLDEPLLRLPVQHGTQ